MAEALNQAESQKVDAIDVHSDGKPDDSKSDEGALKESLKKDLQTLWERKKEGRITDAEYDRYMNAAKTILEKHDTGLSTIKKEYTKERNETMKRSNTGMENIALAGSKALTAAKNVGTEAIATVKQQVASEDTIITFTAEGWHDLVSVKDFEERLRTQSLDQINGLGLKNYFGYLQKKTPITRELLEQKLGSAEKLLELSVLWGTRMEQEFHVRSWGGGTTEKLLATGKLLVSGSSEWAIEKNIFQKVIVENIKKSWLEERLFDPGKGQNRTREQLDKELNGMKYEKIIDEFEKDFQGKKITSATVRAFFEKKVAEQDQLIQKKEAEHKEALGDKTVEDVFIGCKIPEHCPDKGMKHKKMRDLTPEESKQVTKAIGEAWTTVPRDIKAYVDGQNEIDAQKAVKEDIKQLAKKPTSEAIAAVHNRGWSPKDLKRVAKWAVDVGRSARELQSKEKEEPYKETLEQIGCSHLSMEDICKDKKTLERVLLLLEQKKLQDTELYRDLKKHCFLEEQHADNYVMATENITEARLSEQKKQWRRIESFAEEAYERDVQQKKTTDFTVVEQSPSNEKQLACNTQNGIENMAVRLSALREDGKYIPLEKIGGDTCFVTKDRDRYILSINGRTEVCSDDGEVENTLNAYGFFYDMGLRSVTSSMDSFLATVKSSDPICPEFDIRNGFSPQQQIILLGVVNKIFDLDMEHKMSEKSAKAIVPDFTDLLRTIDQKCWFDAGLRKKWILTDQGGFHEAGLRRMLGKKRDT